MQILAGLKKEWLFMTRGPRLIGVILIILAIAAANPLMYNMVQSSLSMAETTPGAAEMLAKSSIDPEKIGSILGADSAIISSFGNLTFAGIIVFMLIIMPMAGGEQKSRGIVMPRLAGLTTNGYVLPKFLFYPLLSFLLTFAGAVTAIFVTKLTMGFGDNPISAYKYGLLIEAAALLGLFVFFVTALYLFAGIATGRPGIAILYTFAGIQIISLLLSMFGITGYNPLSVTTLCDMLVVGAISAPDSTYLSIYPPDGADVRNIVISVTASLILSAIFLFLALFSVKAGEIDNTEKIVL